MERIILGSCDVYLAEYDGKTTPSVETAKVEGNKIGEVSSGGSLEYTNETYTATSDNGKAQKTVLSAETVMLNAGICTIDPEKVVKLCPTARISTADGKTVMKIGGGDNDNGKSYVVLFYHKDKTDGDIAAMIVGKNTAGLIFSFKKANETILEPKFKAEPLDDEGTLAIVEFYDVPEAAASAKAKTNAETPASTMKK